MKHLPGIPEVTEGMRVTNLEKEPYKHFRV